MATLGVKEMGKFLWEGRGKEGEGKSKEEKITRLDTMPLFLKNLSLIKKKSQKKQSVVE